MMKYVSLVAVVLMSLSGVIGDPENIPLDALDSPFLSELKYNLREESSLAKCEKYWAGIATKLGDTSHGADVLKLVSKMLNNRGSVNLAKFTDDCYDILKGTSSVPSRVPIATVSTPSPAASNEFVVKQLLNEQQALKERLREMVEENNALRLRLDMTNINLIKANYMRLEADNNLQACKSKLHFGVNLHLHRNHD